MQDIRFNITAIFSKDVQEPLREKFESSLEYELYWLQYNKFDPLRKFVSAIPYKYYK